jgi:hypothetical protein
VECRGGAQPLVWADIAVSVAMPEGAVGVAVERYRLSQ